MIMKVLRFLPLLLVAACTLLFDPDDASIAGHYTLVSVDSQSFPCCATIDSAGTRTTMLSGSLTLGDAAPELFTTTPAGDYPSSCVHEVPNGARVDPSTFPRCGDGDYTLTFDERVDSAGGASHTTTVTSTGKYAWTDKNPELIKLIDAPMLGSVHFTSGGVELRIQSVAPQGTYGPEYTFTK